GRLRGERKGFSPCWPPALGVDSPPSSKVGQDAGGCRERAVGGEAEQVRRGELPTALSEIGFVFVIRGRFRYARTDDGPFLLERASGEDGRTAGSHRDLQPARLGSGDLHASVVRSAPRRAACHPADGAPRAADPPPFGGAPRAGRPASFARRDAAEDGREPRARAKSGRSRPAIPGAGTRPSPVAGGGGLAGRTRAAGFFAPRTPSRGAGPAQARAGGCH